MSQLDRGNTWVTIFPEEVVTDKDGNTRTRAAAEGVKLWVWLAPVGQSGTSARRAEQDNEGYETEKVLRMRLRRQDADFPVGAQGKVLIDGQLWSVFGDATLYRATRRTAHTEYSLRRA